MRHFRGIAGPLKPVPSWSRSNASLLVLVADAQRQQPAGAVVFPNK